MSEQSSNTSQTASAFYDPDSSSWRTCQGSLLSEAPPSLQHLPPCATTVDGWLYEQATPEHLTAVRDGSASLATPTAWLGRRPSQAIGDAARWHDPERSNELSDQMAALLPTPVVNDMGRGKTPDEWDSWTAEMRGRHGNGNGHGASLAIEAARLLPTPTVQDGANNAGPSQWERNSKPLNVVAVELTLGLTGTLSNDGNVPSDDEHPPQPIAEDCEPSSSSG